jgi:rubrerythrin
MRAMTRTLDFSTLSLQDALDLAILIEDEAEERYQELANLVGGRYPGDASDVFRNMAFNESKHGRQLAERRRQLFGDAPRAVTREMIWEVEAPDYGKPRVFMSPHQATEVAMASERKAHEFFVSALPSVKDPAVHALFEELRDEELHHYATLERHLKDLPPGPDVEEQDADEPPAL